MLQKIKIILVDDSKIFREGLISLFDDFENFEIIAEAENGLEVKELLKIHQPDIILLDINMPEMDGGLTLDYLVKYYEDTPVIMLSQYDDILMQEHYLSRGASGYLSKEASFGIIIETIQKVKDATKETKLSENSRNTFTEREKQIIPFLCNGYSTGQIAQNLNVTNKTVEAHRNRIFQKTKSRSIKDFLLHSISRGYQFLRK